MNRYDLEDIEPEPWVAPKFTHFNQRVQVYKDSKLSAFQQAVKDEFDRQNPGHSFHTGSLAITFWLWRSTDSIRHVADATNCQKALEDALQGILYGDDVANKDVRTVIVAQGEQVRPYIIIEIDEFKIPMYVPSPNPPSKDAIGNEWQGEGKF